MYLSQQQGMVSGRGNDVLLACMSCIHSFLSDHVVSVDVSVMLKDMAEPDLHCEVWSMC